MKHSSRFLFLAAALLLGSCMPNPVQDETVSEPGFFENRRYDYAMRFPVQLTMVEDSVERQLVVSEDGMPIFQIAVERGGIPLPQETRSYDAFVEARLYELCGTGIARCTGIASATSMLTPAGLKGSEYTLTEEVEGAAGLETRTRGPFYVFNMTDAPEAGLAVLVVGAPPDISPERVNGDVIRGIINTLRVGRIGPTENDMAQAKEGEMCGGIAGVICEEGLTCRYEGQYPDAGGTCVNN